MLRTADGVTVGPDAFVEPGIANGSLITLTPGSTLASTAKTPLRIGIAAAQGGALAGGPP